MKRWVSRPSNRCQVLPLVLRLRKNEGTMTSPVFGFSERYRFEADHEATCVQMTASAEPHGIFRLLAPVMAAGIRRQVRADHRRLKALLEHRDTQASPMAAAP